MYFRYFSLNIFYLIILTDISLFLAIRLGTYIT